MRRKSLKKKYGKDILSLKDTRKYINKKFSWVCDIFENQEQIPNYNETISSLIRETTQRVLEQYGPGAYIESVNYDPETMSTIANVRMPMPIRTISTHLVLGSDNETEPT